MDGKFFRNLFYEALHLHRREFFVNYSEIEQAIIVLQNEYSPKEWKSSPSCSLINYNNPAFRCAYLHKYAGCHAALVQDVLLHMLNLDGSFLCNSFLGRLPINICCLGGGPGTDIIGLLSAFCFLHELQYSTFHFTVVDCMSEWELALMSVMTAAQSPQFQLFLSSFLWYCTYLQADMLLPSIPDHIIGAIQSADMLTMVKFVSAAASESTPNMIRMVFNLLKPGALVFFIDNAAGGYYEMLSEQASVSGLSVVCGPFQHVRYENKIFRKKMFGSFSLSTTTITAQMWRKDPPLFWGTYGFHVVPLRPTFGHYGKSHHPSVSTSDFKHGRRIRSAVSRNASESVVSLNSNLEESQAVSDQMQNSSFDGPLFDKESCPAPTEPPVKEELNSTSGHPDSPERNSETSTRKRKVSTNESESLYSDSDKPSAKKRRANESESLSSSSEEPSTSKGKMSPNKTELFFISSEVPRTDTCKFTTGRSKPLFRSHGKVRTRRSKLNTIRRSFKNERNTVKRAIPSFSNVEELPTKDSCLSMQKESIAVTHLKDALQLCSINSSHEDASSEQPMEKEQCSDPESGLEKRFSAVSLSEDAGLGATQLVEKEASVSPSVNLQLESDVITSNL